MKKKTVVPKSPVEYPTGVCVQTEAGYWYINGKFRHSLKNKRVLDSWNFNFIVQSSEAALAKYPKAKPLGFREGTVVGDISNGKIYLISNKSRRLITKPEVYDLLGIKRRDAIWAAHDEVILHPEGEVL